jgi:hypothetical protein
MAAGLYPNVLPVALLLAGFYFLMAYRMFIRPARFSR